MIIAASFFTAAAIVLLFEYLYRRASRRASTLAALGIADTGRAVQPLRSRLLRFPQAKLTRLGKAVTPRTGQDLERLIAESGSDLSAPYLQGLRLAAGSAAAALALPLGFTALLLSPALFAAGFYLPLLFLKRKRRLRLEETASDLPEVADLMAVLCFSGESLSQALQHSSAACSRLSSRGEIEALLERTRLGESTAEALNQAAQHPCRELRRFSRTLLRAEEYGAPIAETLEGLASELRSGRREKERVRASRASVLILFPLVFLILPSFLLLTVGGMILGFTT